MEAVTVSELYYTGANEPQRGSHYNACVVLYQCLRLCHTRASYTSVEPLQSLCVSYRIKYSSVEAFAMSVRYHTNAVLKHIALIVMYYTSANYNATLLRGFA